MLVSIANNRRTRFLTGEKMPLFKYLSAAKIVLLDQLKPNPGNAHESLTTTAPPQTLAQIEQLRPLRWRKSLEA